MTEQEREKLNEKIVDYIMILVLRECGDNRQESQKDGES